MKLRLLFLLLSLSNSLFTYSQTDSCTLRISLLTCSPGAELYSIFGHSALRVVDRSAGTDIVYNYGTFDFNDPEFYSKFVRGKLLYYLSQENFSDFQYDYTVEQRGIIEQILNLSCEEKKQVQQALFVNLQGENKYYKYDFLFDNCTTRLRDLVQSRTNPAFRTSSILTAEKTSFRNLIHFYLNRSKMYWSKFGIDLLLGSKIDRQVTNDEAMFLPDYLEKGFDSTRSGDQSLVVSSRSVLQPGAAVAPAESAISPRIFFYVLLVVFLAMSLFKAKWVKAFFRIGDFVLFFLTGLIGLLMVFMWFGTDHVVCKSNFNLLWALPTHVAAAFFISSDKLWLKRYFLLASLVNLLLLLTWVVLPQQMNDALIPLIFLLGWRSWLRSKR